MPKVFISYSHDSEAHRDRVLALSQRLRRDGVDCTMDLYERAPAEGWPRWTKRQIEGADFILVVCTELYTQRVTAGEPPPSGHGVQYEYELIRNELYHAGMWNRRVVPVLFADADPRRIPSELLPFTWHRADTEAGYLELLAQLTGQLDVAKSALGPRQPLPLRTAVEGLAARGAVPKAPRPHRWSHAWRLGLGALLAVGSGIVWWSWSARDRPPSAEAERQYRRGLSALSQLNAFPAEASLYRALEEHDPYPQALSSHAEALMMLGRKAAAREEALTALRQAARLPRRERLEVEGRSNRILGQWSAAVHAYQELQDASPEADSGVGLAESLLGQALSGEGGRSLEASFEEIRAMAKSAPDPRLDLVEAKAAHALSRTQDKLAAADRALAWAREHRSAQVEAEALPLRWGALLESGDSRTALAEIERERARGAGDPLAMAKRSNAMAQIFLTLGDLDKAREAWTEALRTYEHTKDEPGQARQRLNLATIDAQQGRFAAAKKGFEKAADLFHDLNARDDEAKAWKNLGSLLQNMGDPQGAIEALSKASSLFEELKDAREQAGSLCNLSLSYRENLQPDMAKTPLAQCCNLACDIADDSLVAQAVTGQGDLLAQDGDLEGAWRRYQSSLEIWDRLGRSGQSADVRLLLAEIALDRGRSTEAIPLAERARAEFQRASASPSAAVAEVMLARAHEARGDTAESGRALERAALLLGKDQSLEAHSAISLAKATLAARAGQLAGARKLLEEALKATERHPVFRFQARLAQGSIELRYGDRDLGRRLLTDLENDTRGSYRRIADQAAKLLGEPPRPQTPPVAAPLKTGPRAVGSPPCPCSA